MARISRRGHGPRARSSGWPSRSTGGRRQLSGGEAARAGLAAILLSRFDVLLLDEPTNDLDFDGLDRLERFVDGFAGGLAVVSHDRVFLDRTASRVAEIDPWTGTLREYAGGWRDFEAARALALDASTTHSSARRSELGSCRRCSTTGAARHVPAAR